MECFTQTFLFVCSCDQSVRLTAEMDPIGDFPPRNNLLQTLPSWIKMHYLHWKNSEKVSTQSVLWVFWTSEVVILIYYIHYTLYSIQYRIQCKCVSVWSHWVRKTSLKNTRLYEIHVYSHSTFSCLMLGVIICTVQGAVQMWLPCFDVQHQHHKYVRVYTKYYVFN